MKKKLFAILLAAVMLLSFVPVSFAQGEDITIIATSDIHCNCTNLPKLAALRGSADIMVDNGDSLQGGLIGALSDGEYMAEALNLVGFDLASVGNHDFDYGVEQLLKLEDQLNYPLLSCNVKNTSTGEYLFEPYKIVETKGKKIAFIGISTPHTLTMCNPANFEDENGNTYIDFTQKDGGRELIDLVQKYINEAGEKADYVVLLGHLGDEDAFAPYRSADIAGGTCGVDLIIDGHSHHAYTASYKNKNGDPVPAIGSSDSLSSVMKIVFKADGIVVTELFDLEETEADPKVQNGIELIEKKIDGLKNQIVAKTEVDLTIENEDGSRAIRNKETNLGNLCSDAVRIACGSDIAMINGGGIRANIAAGDVTFGDIVNVHPFGNELCKVGIKGSVLLDVLEFSVRNFPDEFGGFMHFSGLTYSLDASVPSPIVTDDNAVFVKVSGQRRVFDVKVNGEALDPDKTYSLGGIQFTLLSGGDGYSMFKDNVELIADEIVLDHQALISYIVKDMGGVIGSEYAKPQGRITMKENPAAHETQTQVVAPPTALYIVQKGDCLWNIAKRFLGSGASWMQIYKLNTDIIKNPNLIYVGQELRVF